MALSDLIIIPSEELFRVALLLELELLLFCIEIESLLDLELELELELEMDFGLTGCAEEPEAEILLDFDISGKSSSSEVSKRLLLDGFDGFLANGCLHGFELGLLNRKKIRYKFLDSEWYMKTEK